MPQPQNKAAIALERVERIASLYRRGRTYREIGEQLDLSLGQVSHAMKMARAMWRKRATKTYTLHLHEQLAKLDEVEAAAWQGWEKSMGDGLMTGTEDGETPTGSVSKTVVRRTRQSGNASFLKIIQDTVRQRCELLGLLDPDVRDSEATQAQGQVVSIVVDTREEADQLQSLSFEQYASLVSPVAVAEV